MYAVVLSLTNDKEIAGVIFSDTFFKFQQTFNSVSQSSLCSAIKFTKEFTVEHMKRLDLLPKPCVHPNEFVLLHLIFHAGNSLHDAAAALNISVTDAQKRLHTELAEFRKRQAQL
ncbi:MAG: hypothetical protein V4725_02450 [Bacteroidota bacterium]